MSRDIPEADWLVISRELKPLALDRYCRRVLAEVSDVINAEGPSHERYLEMFRVIDRRDRELAQTFNALRRSTAMLQLLGMWSLGIVPVGQFRLLGRGDLVEPGGCFVLRIV